MNCVSVCCAPFIIVNVMLGKMVRHMFGHYGFSGSEQNMNDMSQAEKIMPRYTLDVSWASDVGRVRGENEDNFACDLGVGLLVLADGMGGCQAGEVASAIAVSTVMQELAQKPQSGAYRSQYDAGALSPVVTRMCNAVNLANQAVFEAAMLEPQLAGMGSTLVIAQFHDDKVTVANIGDSRLYLQREGVFRQLTVDHTVLQEQIEYGLPPLNEFQRIAAGSMLTRALGIESQIMLDVFEQNVCPGDIFLLCSDGLYDMLSDDEMGMILLNSAEKKLDQVAQDLVSRANEKGGMDNITLILVKAGHSRLTVL